MEQWVKEVGKQLISNVELSVGDELIQRTWWCESCQVRHTDNFPTSDGKGDKAAFCAFYQVWKELMVQLPSVSMT